MKISFAHNVQNRFRTLHETIEKERIFFPDAPIYVGYNDSTFKLRYFEDLKNIKFIQFRGAGHKIGCVNGCIIAIKESLKDDSDFVVFSHDDVKIGHIEVFKKNLDKVKNGLDVVCRKPHSYGDNYYMMEGFFMNKNAAKKIFQNKHIFTSDKQLPKDLRGSASPEVWLHDVIVGSDVKVECTEYKHSLNNYNKVLSELLGFNHKNAGIRGWTD